MNRSITVTLCTYIDSGLLEAKFVSILPHRLIFKSDRVLDSEPLELSVLRSLGGTIDLEGRGHIIKLVNNTDFNLWVSSAPIAPVPPFQEMECVPPHSAINSVFVTTKTTQVERMLSWKLENHSSSTGTLKYLAPLEDHLSELMKASLDLVYLPIDDHSILFAADVTVCYRLLYDVESAATTNLEIELGVFILHEFADGRLQLCVSSSITPEKWNFETITVEGPIKLTFSPSAEQNHQYLRIRLRCFERGRCFVGSICRKYPAKWRICSEIHLLHVD